MLVASFVLDRAVIIFAPQRVIDDRWKIVRTSLSTTSERQSKAAPSLCRKITFNPSSVLMARQLFVPVLLEA